MPNLALAKRLPGEAGSAPGPAGLRASAGSEQRPDDLIDSGGDPVGGIRPVDQPELAMVTVIADQRCRLLEEDLDPVVDDVGAGVLAGAPGRAGPGRPPRQP